MWNWTEQDANLNDEHGMDMSRLSVKKTYKMYVGGKQARPDSGYSRSDCFIVGRVVVVAQHCVRGIKLLP